MKKHILKIINTDLCKIIFINILVALFCIIFCDSIFETNDDHGMASIIYGVSCGSSCHVVFINIFLGKILTTILNIFPKLPWYGISQYFLVFLSFITINFILIKKKDKWCGFFLSAIILIFGAYEFYVKLQFTKTAGIATIAGTLLIFYSLKKRTHQLWSLCFGGLMILVGSFYRFDGSLLALLVLSTLGVVIINEKFKESKSIKGLLNIKEYFLVFGIIFALIFAFKIADSKIYQMDEGWSDFVEYNQKRAVLLDHGFPDYDKFQDEYEKLNISQNDLNLFSSWIFADPDVFNIELMDNLIALKTKKEINLDFIKNYFKLFPYSFFQEKLFLISLILFIIWILDDKKKTITVTYLLLIIFGTNFFFYYQDRYLQHRVDVVLWMSVLCILAYLINEIPLINKQNYKKSIVCFVFILAVFNIESYWTSIESKKNTVEENTFNQFFYKLVGENKEKLFLNLPTDYRFACFMPLNVMSENMFSNIYALGGWGIKMPLTNKILESYGIYNPFSEMVNNPNIYLITSGYPDNIISYIQDHYDEHAYAVLVKSYHGYEFYKIVSGKISIDNTDAINFDNTVYSDYKVSVNEETKEIKVEGNIYKKGCSSFEEELMLKKKSKDSGEEEYCYITLYENNAINDVYKGKYSEFSYSTNIPDYEDMELELVLNVGNKKYKTKIN